MYKARRDFPTQPLDFTSPRHRRCSTFKPSLNIVVTDLSVCQRILGPLLLYPAAGSKFNYSISSACVYFGHKVAATTTTERKPMDLWRGAVRRLLLDPSTNHRHSEEDYELLSDRDSPILPNGSTHHHHHSRTLSLGSRRSSSSGWWYSLRSLLFSCISSSQKCTLRRFLTSLLLFPFLAVVVLLWGGIPPGYEDIRGYERRLPQHNLSLPFPEGAGGLYLRFPGHLWGHGLNNILQETCVSWLYVDFIKTLLFFS